MGPNETLFEETQKSPPSWVWVLVGAIVMKNADELLSVDEPSNRGDKFSTSRRLSNRTRLTLIAAVGWLLGLLKLETQVRDEGIYFKLYPLHHSFRRIPWEELQEVELQDYSGFNSLYGRGFRWGPGIRIYSVAGDRSLVFHRTTGADVALTSQNPDAFIAAIDEARERESV